MLKNLAIGNIYSMSGYGCDIIGNRLENLESKRGFADLVQNTMPVKR